LKDPVKLERYSRIIFISSAIIWAVSAWFKDSLPPPSFYNQSLLQTPIQVKSEQKPFSIQAGNEKYEINPIYSYELNGVVVTYSNASGFTNIWHHKRWKDFINLRDLCVIWGQNVSTGVYRKLHFSSDSWTCWVDWPDKETGIVFHGDQLSNNHLLTHNPWLQNKLMEAEPGDQIRLVGHLVEYGNRANSFRRGTSTTRTDTGQGACETVYLSNFIIVKKANPGWRFIYKLAKWMTLMSFIAVILLMFIAPYEKYREKDHT
jgi:hypothetical protein